MKFLKVKLEEDSLLLLNIANIISIRNIKVTEYSDCEIQTVNGLVYYVKDKFVDVMDRINSFSR